MSSAQRGRGWPSFMPRPVLYGLFNSAPATINAVNAEIISIFWRQAVIYSRIFPAEAPTLLNQAPCQLSADWGSGRGPADISPQITRRGARGVGGSGDLADCGKVRNINPAPAAGSAPRPPSPPPLCRPVPLAEGRPPAEGGRRKGRQGRLAWPTRGICSCRGDPESPLGGHSHTAG